ncbi:MAG: TaqI-like C-terminal specificity domain-containing protein [Chloroflexota bacterium]|nr:TaqI-like C-terminal specificity domain-containing protein [Chloroflexota bacterium]
MISLNIHHLNIRAADDIFETFRLLGYNINTPYAYEDETLDDFEFEDSDRANVRRAFVIARHEQHTVYLYEVDDLRATRLRSLGWHALQRGNALLIVTRDYREVIFADVRFAGKPNKSSVRVNKLSLVTHDPTRHDLDTLNAIHAHRRSGQQIYDAQRDAFNVNTMTRRFYDEYRRHYERTRAVIRQYNKGIREFQNEDQADKLHAFTQRLLGRLMFLYFLQRKGWLGGRSKFLTEQYMTTLRKHSDALDGDGDTTYYYREVLSPLFFETMNLERPGAVTRWEGVRIPYLNGGLFDENRDPQGIITLPDALFDPNSNDGLLAFFNRYNFTVADDTPLEQDVAVDPEMLGKVFENLLEERDRGQSGSFYTPRPIVSYMCQEALAGYLEESAGLPRETTRALFNPDADARLTPDEATRVNAALDTMTVLDPAVGSGSFLIGMMQEILRLRRAAYDALNSPLPAQRLGEGTGVRAEPPPALVADWKEAIIRDTLYGVDIKPEAIEIAQLRLWLALVVDQTLEQARPLPNLDYKLMAGNSLIETLDGEPVLGSFANSVLANSDAMAWEQINQQLKMFDPNPVQGRMLLFDEEKQAEKERVRLDALRREYFHASPERRRALRDELKTQERRIVYASLKERADALQAQIDYLGKQAGLAGGKLKAGDQRKLTATIARLARITSLQTDMAKPDYAPPFFLYHLHFSEVFERKGGFDIVIANPPYVDAREITNQKPELKLAFSDVYSGSADLYVFFYARAYQLLKNDGQLAFITSNKYMRTVYGESLRRFLTTYVTLHVIADFGDLPIFDAAAYPCIVLGLKTLPTKNEIHGMHIDDASALDDLRSHVTHSAAKFPQTELGEKPWQLTASSFRKLVEKIWDVSVPLRKHLASDPYSGIKTAANDVFEINKGTLDQLFIDGTVASDVVRKWLRGRDVKKWAINTSGLYVIAFRNSNDVGVAYPWSNAHSEREAEQVFLATFPTVYEYLKRHETKLRNRSDQGQWWWELRSCTYYDAFATAKIVWAKYGITPSFAYDSEGTLATNTVFFLPTKDMYLLGVLNSMVTQWYATSNFNLVQGGYIEWIPANVKMLPIPNSPPALREQIAAVARACLDAAKDAPERLSALEAQLNALVYQAYGLDDDDIAVIERSVGGKGGRGDEPSLEDTD